MAGISPSLLSFLLATHLWVEVHSSLTLTYVHTPDHKVGEYTKQVYIHYVLYVLHIRITEAPPYISILSSKSPVEQLRLALAPFCMHRVHVPQMTGAFILYKLM